MRVCLFLALCVLLPACDFFWDHGDAIPFRNVEEAGHLNVEQPGTAVFNDADSWEAFWYEHVTASPTPLPPPIDFARRTAVGVFWDAQSGCDRRVEAVERVSRSAPHAVEVEVGPLPDLGPCDAIVQPVQVITFRKAQHVGFVGIVPQ